MNGDENKFNVSQEYEIIQHQKDKAYPIGVKEWNFLKEKIRRIKVQVNNFHAVGFLLLGASASCLITVLATTFSDDKSKYLCWSIFFISFIGGVLSLFFAKDKHKEAVQKPQEIIDQMELIESRFKTE